MPRPHPTRRTAAAAGATAVGALLLPPRPPRGLVVLGDSWAAGLHADPQHALGQVTAARLGWSVVVDAVSGTGYVAGAAQRRSYVDRVAALDPRARADVVVVQGGSNDRSAPREALAAAAHRTLTGLRDRFPLAHRVVLGPGPDPEPVTAGQRAIDDLLHEVAAREGVPYLSILRSRWIERVPAGRVLDGANHHPTVAGQRYLGRRLEQSLRRLYPRLTRH